MRFRNILVAFIYCVSVGCSGHEIDFVQTGKYPVELEITKGYMASTIVTERDTQLVVTGRVVRTDHKRGYIKGYVEVKIINSDGKILDSAKSQYITWAARRTRSKSTFEVKFDFIPSAQTKLLINHVVLS